MSLIKKGLINQKFQIVRFMKHLIIKTQKILKKNNLTNDFFFKT